MQRGYEIFSKVSVLDAEMLKEYEHSPQRKEKQDLLGAQSKLQGLEWGFLSEEAVACYFYFFFLFRETGLSKGWVQIRQFTQRIHIFLF